MRPALLVEQHSQEATLAAAGVLDSPEPEEPEELESREELESPELAELDSGLVVVDGFVLEELDPERESVR